MIKFGTGGWRGLIGEEFTRENVELAARAMVQLLTDEKKTERPVIIGYERRQCTGLVRFLLPMASGRCL